MDKKTKERLEEFDPQLRPVLERSLEGMDQLIKAAEEDAARVPEPIFVQHILPILTRTGEEQDLTVWQEIAGHVMRPIDVYDPSTDKYLFRVPPVLRSIDKNFTGRGQNSAFEIIKTAEKKGQIVPAMRDQHYQKNLVDKVTRIPIRQEDVTSWDRILKRYGYEGLLEEEKKPEENPSEDQELGFSGEYDDL